MDTSKHDIKSLFAQLGLANTEQDIDTFVTQNTLTESFSLVDAPFWNASQRTFLSEALAEDAEWTAAIDELDTRLRED